MTTVIVVGAGPAGAVTAGLLAREGFAVTLLDRLGSRADVRGLKDPRVRAAAEASTVADGRAAAAAAVIAAGCGPADGRALVVGESLPPAARPLLQSAGLMHALIDATPAYGTLSAWGGDVLGVNDHCFSPHGDGWTLDRARFDARLRAWACTQGVRWIAAKVVSACEHDNGVSVKLDDGLSLTGAYAVDASGRRAVLATRLGVVRGHVDALVAMVTPFATSDSHDPDARVLVEAAAYGWWYTVRVPCGQRVVALLTDPRPHQAHPRVSFLQRLMATRFCSATLLAHGYRAIAAPRGMDARTGRLSRVHGRRWLATGDAAFSVDPLSSQGIADALWTSNLAVQALKCARAGERAALERYATRVDALFARYLELRTSTYALERRWDSEPFWRQRHRVEAAAVHRGR